MFLTYSIHSEQVHDFFLFSTEVNAVFVAKLLILGILLSISVILVL